MPIDYSRYPPNWKTELRPAVLERAGDRCEQCKVRNYAFVYRGIQYGVELYQYNGDNKLFLADCGTHFAYGGRAYPLKKSCSDIPKAIKIILTVAHLDHDEHNHDVKLDRLKALCQRCHLRYDAPEKARRRRLKK